MRQTCLHLRGDDALLCAYPGEPTAATFFVGERDLRGVYLVEVAADRPVPYLFVDVEELTCDASI